MNERDPVEISAAKIKIQPGDRKLIRVDKRISVSYMVVNGKDQVVWKDAISNDVTRNGISLETKENIEKASLLEVKLNTDEGTIDLKGEVMRAIPRPPDLYMIGVRFVDIPEDDLGKLVRFVDLFQRPPLEEEITPAMATYFTQHLFKNNKNLFLEVARNITEAANWEIAFKRIDEYWSKLGIDLYSEASIRFTDMVFDRY